MSISEERIERAAQAMWKAHQGPSEYPWEEWADSVKDEWRDRARIALEEDAPFAAAEYARGVRDGLTKARGLIITRKGDRPGCQHITRDEANQDWDCWRKNECACEFKKEEAAAIVAIFDALIAKFAKGEGT